MINQLGNQFISKISMEVVSKDLAKIKLIYIRYSWIDNLFTYFSTTQFSALISYRCEKNITECVVYFSFLNKCFTKMPQFCTWLNSIWSKLYLFVEAGNTC